MHGYYRYTHCKVELFDFVAEVNQQCCTQVRMQRGKLPLAQVSVPQSNTNALR